MMFGEGEVIGGLRKAGGGGRNGPMVWRRKIENSRGFEWTDGVKEGRLKVAEEGR